MQRFGQLSAAAPDALADLASPAFADWLAKDRVVRLGRLLGSVPAVLRLLADYRSEAPPPAVAEVPGCPAPDDSAVPTYFALSAADLERLAARSALHTALAPVAAERFADRTGLVDAVDAVLGVSLPDCGARRVEATLTRHEAEATVYDLDPDGLQQLALDPDLGDVLPALQPLAKAESASRDVLVAGIEAAIRSAVGQAAGAAATQAADAAAAAAEDVSPSPDTPAPGMPAAEAKPPAEEFAITDSSLLMLQSAVPDPALLEAISSTPYRPQQSRDQVRFDALSALQPVVSGISEARTRARLEAVLPSVRARWRLGEATIADIAADPAFAAVPPETLAAANGIAGIAYPDQRLFERALASLPVPVDDATRAAILEVARKRVDEPYASREVTPIASDCGCNVARKENSLVYGFFPFWNYAGSADAAGERVDFELVGRIAFDGLVIDEHGR